MERIDAFVVKGCYGYQSRAEFLREAARLRLERLYELELLRNDERRLSLPIRAEKATRTGRVQLDKKEVPRASGIA